MNVLAIDPGTLRSAYVLLDDECKLLDFGILANFEMVFMLRQRLVANQVLAIEMIASYGMPVGREVFETCVWIGRFAEAHRDEWHRVYRKDVKMHLCGSTRAKDPNVRQALLDRYGPGREIAIGTKRAQGPLYGVSADVWAALAVGVTFQDRQKLPRVEGSA